MVFDHEGFVVRACTHAPIFFGFRGLVDIIGRHIESFYYWPHDRMQKLRAINTSGHIHNYPVAMKQKNGQLLMCTVSAKLLNRNEHSFDGLELIIYNFANIFIKKHPADNHGGDFCDIG